MYAGDLDPDVKLYTEGWQPRIWEKSQRSTCRFVMVMTGHQAKQVIFSKNGLLIIFHQAVLLFLTATIKPAEAAEIIIS